MDLENAKLGIKAQLKDDFTQAEYEKYQTELVEITEEAKAAGTVERGIIQAALNSGIMTGYDKPLLEASPRLIKWLNIKVRDFIIEQTEVPQE